MPSVDQREVTAPAIQGLQLIKKIGAGGFGEVWLARHQTMSSQLRAVKVVHRESFATVSAFREEFKGLEHYQEISRESQYLVSIFQVGHTDDLYFYEMELADDASSGRACDGSDEGIAHYESLTLKKKVQRDPAGFLSARACCLVGRDLTEAVECLHNDGFTHRDIKPENIVFVKGIPRLADIGALASQIERKPVTALGYTPEEGAGSNKADIFSLGRTLFLASSGQEPLHHFGSYPDAYYDQDLHERKKLEGIIDKATQQSPKARYGSIHVMRRELEQVAVSYERAQRRRRWLLVAGIAVSAMMGLAALSALLPGLMVKKDSPEGIPARPIRRAGARQARAC